MVAKCQDANVSSNVEFRTIYYYVLIRVLKGEGPRTDWVEKMEPVAVACMEVKMHEATLNKSVVPSTQPANFTLNSNTKTKTNTQIYSENWLNVVTSSR